MSNKKKDAVVILGAGIMQIPAIKTAREEGFAPLVFDGNPEPAGLNEAEVFSNIDIKDYVKIHEKCIELGTQYSVKGVFTAGTDFSYIVAKLSEMMNLPGISYETALNATVKSRMREVFSKHGVSSPRFLVAERGMEADLEENRIDFPVVVKPVDSMGGRGSVKIESFESLGDAVDNAVQYSRSGKAIIEEFLEGAEFSLDAVVEDNDITVCGIADRHIFFPPYFVEMGHTMPSIYPEEVQARVAEVFKDGIKAIGIDNGAAKGDIKYSGGRAVVGEIAARLSGGYMSGWTFPYSSGVSVIRAALNIALGKNSGLGKYGYTKTAVERAFISIPGKVSEIILPPYLENRTLMPPEIKDVFINIRKNDRVVFPRNNVEKCGNIITASENRDNAVNAAERGCRDIIIRLECCDRETGDFLLKGKEEWIPDAFLIEDKDNIKAVYSMENIKTAENYDENKKTAVEMIPFPGNEHSVDWLGRAFDESLEKIFELTGAETVKPEAEYNAVLGAVFWKAFKAGGIQGGIWIIETAEKYLKEGKLPDSFF